ncbi:hypothetical protein BEWA_009080 [Theileria equi strain WA]|uniref:Uncharacterized protein n=1 Tax=Theileria equi strain WA TaxID=1537102 RepID=L0B2P9_THEEQ|nr:hypothetical protein BEWA_009080 [Theileria equi strain WA]AFZ81496.1 hypothetical protein BEWA_009080 [Theileria equi strain WA]|eukprot:XP_004831162.1 hypothetical protein BEWA_009080 [Theileria equi strain WA]
MQKVNHDLLTENARLKKSYRLYKEALAKQEAAKPLQVRIKVEPNFTALVCISFAIPADVEYKVIIIESKGGVVENASTVYTRDKVLLKDLEPQKKYHVTAHCTVEDQKFNGQAWFVYDQSEYTLRVQVDENVYKECKFNKTDNAEVVATKFIGANGLKGLIKEALKKSINEMIESNETTRVVDVMDLVD